MQWILDLRKAFDTVDYCILLDKLYKYGIRGLFYSYLENRKQYICYSDTLSASNSSNSNNTNELRECTSVDVFKKRLKTHLFHLHY